MKNERKKKRSFLEQLSRSVEEREDLLKRDVCAMLLGH